ncbi:tetratricopeptide repeat protein [Marinobacter fuscus]|uniref:tetratricopeptide repeat protein n=1 Tax=Marinobacter fuscus TaxID=2109942 RepID=UPI0010571025|nr:tetratricopeptide repeat protein [Marinobacter fuscus]
MKFSRCAFLTISILAPFGDTTAIPITPDPYRDYSEVQATAAEAEELFPGLKQALEQGRFSYLKSRAKDVLQQNPGSVLSYEVLGTVYLLEGSAELSAEMFQKAVDLYSDSAELWTKLGSALMEADHLERAEQALRKALSLNESYRLAHQRLGLLYEYWGKTDKAIFHLSRGVANTPDTYIGVATNLGRLLNERGAYSDTLAILEPRLNKVASAPAEAWLILATAHLQSGSPEKAKTGYLQWLDEHPGSREGRLGLVMAERASGYPEKALAMALELVDQHPGWLPAHMEVAEIYLQSGRLDKAKPFLDKSVNLGADKAAVQSRMAMYQRDQGQLDEAIETLEKLVASNDATPDVFTFLSELYVVKAGVEKGLEPLVEAKNRFPDSAYVRFRLGSLLAASRQYPAAIEEFEHAYRLDEQSALALEGLVAAQARAGLKEDAVKTAKRLLLLRPNEPGAHLIYASRLEQAGKPDQAINAYRNLLAIAPDHALGLNNLSVLLLGSGENSESISLARKAVEVDSKRSIYRDTLGWALYRTGQIDEALAQLKRAVELDDRNPTIRYHLGTALIASGQIEQGRSQLRQALSMNGGAYWAEKARALMN